jgi:hypothetical protein
MGEWLAAREIVEECTYHPNEAIRLARLLLVGRALEDLLDVSRRITDDNELALTLHCDRCFD